MKRNEIVEVGYELAKELFPGEGYLESHIRKILEEFTKKLANKLTQELSSYDCIQKYLEVKSLWDQVRVSLREIK